MFFATIHPSKHPLFGAGLLRFEEAIDLFREVDGTMSLNTLATFVHVSRRLSVLAAGETNLKKIAKEMDLPYSSLIRQLAILSEGRPGVRHLDLLQLGISADENADRRERIVRMKQKGLNLLRAVNNRLEI